MPRFLRLNKIYFFHKLHMFLCTFYIKLSNPRRTVIFQCKKSRIEIDMLTKKIEDMQYTFLFQFFSQCNVKIINSYSKLNAFC